MVKTIETVTGVNGIYMGKPGDFAYELIENHHFQGVEKCKIIMVGDNLETDILFGQRNGIDTLLVLSGVTNEKMIEKVAQNCLNSQN